MVRLAVTGWLVVATLLGPWLCCCTAAASPAQPTAVAVIPSAAAPKASCCGHKKAAEPQPNDPRPGHPDHECPCKAGVAKASVAPPPVVEFEFLASVSSALLPAFEIDTAAGFSFAHADRGEGPSLSADVLLHVFHNLRC